jgi:hypothetical protein
VSESQERQVNLKKDLTEMQEWMAQVGEGFLVRETLSTRVLGSWRAHWKR